jgi:hypothetical protein
VHVHVLPDVLGGADVTTMGEKKLACDTAAALTDLHICHRVFDTTASLSSSAIAIDNDHGEDIGFRSMRHVARHGSGFLRSPHILVDAWYAQEQKTVCRPSSWP